MRVTAIVLLGAVSLTGCVFGYFAPAPKGYGGDFVLKTDMQLSSCSLGPGLWSGSTPGTCIGFGCEGKACPSVPAGTHVTVLHTFVDANGERDVSVRVGSGASSRTVHAQDWNTLKEYLVRP